MCVCHSGALGAAAAVVFTVFCSDMQHAAGQIARMTLNPKIQKLLKATKENQRVSGAKDHLH